VVVGLSGGGDSVALLDAMVTLQERGGVRVIAAHLDHGLRPDSADDAAFCRSLCERLGVTFRSAVADVRARAASERGGIEQAARSARYEFLRAVRRETGAAAIAVAHTRDDQAETLLLRLLRGAGATGLGGMRPRRGRIVRPLLGISRAEVRAHLRERGLAWREDPTNTDLKRVRNRIRHELLPYLEARFNPALREGLLADEAEHLRAEADALLDVIGHAEGDALVIDRMALGQAPAPVARVAVRQALGRAGGLGRIGAVHIERILALARSAAPSGRRVPLPGGREVRYGHGALRLGPRPPVVAAGSAGGRKA
jgi:tRNA(Ile)-lysidine synthase